MSNFPTRTSIPDYMSRFPKITQKGTFWCIPASIENMLKFMGIDSLAQTDIMVAYGRKFGKDSLCNQKTGTTPSEPWDDEKFIQEAYGAQLKHPSFGNFKTIVEESNILQQTNFEFDIIYGTESFLDEIKRAISNGELASISFGSHVGVVVELNNDAITYYDPWPDIDDFVSQTAGDIDFNNDLAGIKKKRKLTFPMQFIKRVFKLIFPEFSAV